MSPAGALRLEAQSGCAFTLRRGDALQIIDPHGGQVADLMAFGLHDLRETFSSGRTLDYNASVFLSSGAALYSNRSNVMLRIEQDDVRRHDFLLTPCSERMFEILRGQAHHNSCLTNLANALRRFGLGEDDVHSTFNAFMHVVVGANGRVDVLPPTSQPGECVVLRAQMDLVVGLTACSSEHSNAGRCKPIDYQLLGPQAPPRHGAPLTG